MALFAASALSACSKEVLGAPIEDMEYFYNESRGLTSVSSDSVQRFAAKFQLYVNRNPECLKNPDYYDILNNIEIAAQTYGLYITIYVDTSWERDTIYVNY